MLRILTANRQESLLLQLAAALGPAAAGDPLAPDLLIAERGTDRWLWQFLAETHGIAANLKFEPPAGFIWRMLRLYMPDAPSDARFDRAALAWRIARLLPPLLARDEFAPLAGYLAQDDGRKLHQLSDRIAGVFNDYLVYRPAMILGWQQGKLATAHDDERWQQKLWQAVVGETGTLHRAGLLDEFLNRPRGEKPEKLPARAAIFGIPALPPVYVRALIALGEHIDIDLYVLNPCGQFWGDLGNPKHVRRLDDSHIDSADIPNRLLASWGQPIRHFISELHGHPAELLDLHQSLPAPGTLLHRLQNDIHELTETPATLSAGDDSLRITSAYGAMREVEILHDTLLDRFQRDHSLLPRDVLVMIPDIERYAPNIEAVFGAAEGARFIPWTITDLSHRGSQPLAAAVEQLLRLPDSRFAASEVIGLLETPAIARRFRFDNDMLGTLRAALQRARLHGELDADTRAARGLPRDSTHTWQFALQRLFLGVAMDAQDGPVLGVLPEPAFEGQATAALGRLQTFIDRLAHWQKLLARPQTPAQWVASLHALLDEFFAADDDEQAVLDDVLKAIREFFDETEAAQFTGELPPIVFRDNFFARLQAPASRGNLRTGGVVFCGMVPMRSLPYRMIALLGMNGDSFPRQQRAPGFDLVTLSPQPGDRSRRHDDRHLFLETLLSARESLYISYTGRSLQDDSPREPSVLVRELLDQVVATHGGEAARKDIEKQLLTEHPLQPFSRRYFAPAAAGEPALFSCDPDWLLSARAIRSGAIQQPVFCQPPLPPPDDARREIELDRLAGFFANPARGFLRERFGIGLYEQDEGFDDNEPFLVGGLEGYTLKSEVLAARLAGADSETLQRKLRARGDLPQAAFGELAWQAIAGEVEPFVRTLGPVLVDRVALDIDLVIDTADGPRRLHGRLPDVTADNGLVVRTVASFREKHLLPAWVRHLALLTTAPDGIPPRSLIVARGNLKKGQAVAAHTLGAVADPRAELARLIALFDAGLRAPLPLLPACSQALAEAADEDTAQRDALRAWEGDRFGGHPGEREDTAVRIVFGSDAPPFDEHFVALAHTVYAPLLAALTRDEQAGGDDA